MCDPGTAAFQFLTPQPLQAASGQPSAAAASQVMRSRSRQSGRARASASALPGGGAGTTASASATAPCATRSRSSHIRGGGRAHASVDTEPANNVTSPADEGGGVEHRRRDQSAAAGQLATASRLARPPTRGRLSGGLPPGFVYIGRGGPRVGLPPSPWANRTRVIGSCTAAEAVAMFERDLAQHDHMRARLPGLLGRTLVWHCAPADPCHADAIIADAVAYVRDIPGECPSFRGPRALCVFGGQGELATCLAQWGYAAAVLDKPRKCPR